MHRERYVPFWNIYQICWLQFTYRLYIKRSQPLECYRQENYKWTCHNSTQPVSETSGGGWHNSKIHLSHSLGQENGPWLTSQGLSIHGMKAWINCPLIPKTSIFFVVKIRPKNEICKFFFPAYYSLDSNLASDYTCNWLLIKYCTQLR